MRPAYQRDTPICLAIAEIDIRASRVEFFPNIHRELTESLAYTSSAMGERSEPTQVLIVSESRLVKAAN
jgi:hypothetical protein